jgi:hypothetical protein
LSEFENAMVLALLFSIAASVDRREKGVVASVYRTTCLVASSVYFAVAFMRAW